MTTHAREVREVVEGFESDWHRERFDPGERGHLMWSPGSRDGISRFIDETRRTLLLQNERFLDVTIVERIVRAARRGVKVHVMTRSPDALRREKLLDGVANLRILDDVGVKVRKLDHPRLHGKLPLADGVAAVVGSINLTRGSIDDRRELAIEVRDGHILDRLVAVARRDWKRSRPVDLSAEALATELQEREALDASRSRSAVRAVRLA